MSVRTDAAFGAPSSGGIRAPFLLLVQAKHGLDVHSPATRLNAVLAAALLNARATGQYTQRIHGAYTVGAKWTFVRADVEGLDTERPSFMVVTSPELSEKYEAATIVKILKSIVALHRQGRA